MRHSQHNSQSTEVDIAICDSLRPRLSRYLDNDLPGDAATDIAAHLAGCTACCTEYEGLLGVRSALRRDSSVPSSDSVRDRVFVRLERASRVAEAERLALQEQKRLQFDWRALLGWRRPALATLTAVALVAGGLVVIRPWHGSETNRAARTPGSPVALPAPEHMSALFQLHDAGVEAVSQIAADENSQQGPQHDDSAPGSPHSAPAAGAKPSDGGGNVAPASDEVPEAL